MSNLFNLLSAMCGKIKKADLSQNDPEAADYVKNRTHWKETNIATMVDNEALVFESWEEPSMWVETAIPFDCTAGKQYTVVWDGTTYELEAFDLDAVVAIGNPRIVYDDGSGDFDDLDNGIPFLLSVYEGFLSVGVFDNPDGETHTISIIGEVTTVHQLPEEYVPDITLSKISDYERDVYIFSLSATSLTKNRTYEEISNALYKQKMVLCQYFSTEDSFIPCVHRVPYGGPITFAGYIYHNGEYKYIRIVIKRDETVEVADGQMDFLTITKYGGLKLKSQSGKYFKINVDDNGTLSTTEVTE